jgi:uncharacterized tellurite resistance protein B-like protein
MLNLLRKFKSNFRFYKRSKKPNLKLIKLKLLRSLWSIIYSNNEADIYETNLMRRLAGLLYIDSSTMGDIKDRIKNEKL